MKTTEFRIGTGSTVIGELKWYDPKPGYGFIVDQKTGHDILLGETALKRFGWSAIAVGSQVEARIVETARGFQVAEILSISPPSEMDNRNVFDFHALEFLSNEFVQARVISYNKSRGYGFASTYGDGEDCFVHWSALEEAGLLAVYPGDVISIRIGRSENRRVAASIRPWKSAPKKPVQCGAFPALVAA